MLFRYEGGKGIEINGEIVTETFYGPARDFKINGVLHSKQELAHNEVAESATEWCTRIAVFYIAPVTIESDYDAQLYSSGISQETLVEGWYVVTHPNPVLKDDAFEILVSSKVIEISTGAENLLESLATEYGAMERSTWDQQYDEALAHDADNTVDVPLLDSIATSRGMDVSELVRRIKNNRTEWVQLSGGIIGQRLAYQDLVDTAVELYTTDPAQALIDVQGITVDYTVPTVTLVDK